MLCALKSTLLSITSATSTAGPAVNAKTVPGSSTFRNWSAFGTDGFDKGNRRSHGLVGVGGGQQGREGLRQRRRADLRAAWLILTRRH
eukprot:2038844-Rhodomonas_salina.2